MLSALRCHRWMASCSSVDSASGGKGGSGTICSGIGQLQGGDDVPEVGVAVGGPHQPHPSDAAQHVSGVPQVEPSGCVVRRGVHVADGDLAAAGGAGDEQVSVPAGAGVGLADAQLNADGVHRWVAVVFSTTMMCTASATAAGTSMTSPSVVSARYSMLTDQLTTFCWAWAAEA